MDSAAAGARCARVTAPHTRIPHDRDYVARLGAAVYAFAYLEWRLLTIIRMLDPAMGHRETEWRTSGQVAHALRAALATADIPQELEQGIGERFAALVEIRNDIIHAHPATHPEQGQRLDTWAPRRRRFGWVDDELLSAFIHDVESVSRDANTLRESLRQP